MAMHKGMVGRVPTKEDNGPGSAWCSGRKEEHTLGDYLNKKYKHDAFDVIAAEKRMTFEEWYSQSGWAATHRRMLSLDDADAAKYIMRQSWNAAQENVPSQAPGTEEN